MPDEDPVTTATRSSKRAPAQLRTTAPG
jgi:hypothetical protein